MIRNLLKYSHRRFAALVLSLFFFMSFVGCQNHAYLELLNSTGRDLVIRITHAYGAEYYDEVMRVPSGEKATKEIILKGANHELIAEAMEFNLFEDGNATGFMHGAFYVNQTVSKEIIGLLRPCPDSRFIGTWQSTWDKAWTIKFENSNKCKINPSKSYVSTHGNYNYEEWKIDGSNISFRAWYELTTKGGDIAINASWKSAPFLFVDSSRLRITTIADPTDYDEFKKIQQ